MNDVHEKIGEIGARAKAAHARIDKLEGDIRDDLKIISADLKELNAYMHRGKGWASGLIFLSGLSGAGIVKLLSIVFS